MLPRFDIKAFYHIYFIRSMPSVYLFVTLFKEGNLKCLELANQLFLSGLRHGPE